jgi:voltage-gated potassium channel Kch
MSWIFTEGVEEQGAALIYLKSLYFILVTMTTIGYGDITPEGTEETVTLLFIMMLSSGLFGYILNSLTIILGKL